MSNNIEAKMMQAFAWPLRLMALFACCALGACSPAPSWNLANITHHLPDLRFAGLSQDGAPVDASAVRGKIVLLYFGFTHCAEDCPIVMARLSQVLSHLGPAADQIRIVFVSLDPAHDQVPVLGRYLKAFDANHSIGVTASDSVTESLAKRYRVAFYPAGPLALDADLPHSAATYVFDSSGHARLLLTPRDSDAHVEQDLQRLLAERVDAASGTP